VFCLVRPTRKHKEPASDNWTWTPGLIFEGHLHYAYAPSRIFKNRPTDPGRDLFCFLPPWPEADYGKTCVPIPDNRNHRFLEGPGAPETTPKGGARPRLFWFLGPPGPSRIQKSMANPGPDFFCVAFPAVRGRLRQTLFGGPSASGLLAMLGGFSADCGQNLIQNSLHNDGPVLHCRLHRKSARRSILRPFRGNSKF